jgi:hypothetical protein
MNHEERAAKITKTYVGHTDQLLVDAIHDALLAVEKDTWNAAVEASANQLVKALSARLQLGAVVPGLADEDDEVRIWGKLMVFSIKDLLKS